MEIQKNMSKMMKALKEAHRQSLSEFSEELGIARSTLQRLLDEDENISLLTVEQISEKLGISPATLMFHSFDEPQLQVILLLLQTIDAVSKLEAEKRKEFANLFLQMVQLLEPGNEDYSIKNNNVIWLYQAVPEEGYHPDIGSFRTYGIRVMPQEPIHDISTDRAMVERMAKLYTEHQLFPIHLYDAVEDMLP